MDPDPQDAPLPAELSELGRRLPEPHPEADVQPATRRSTDTPTGVLPDLLAEDLAAFALDLARVRTADEVVAATAHAVVGLVRGASDAAVCVLRRGEVELTAATGDDTESCEAWQLALGSGPAAEAATAPGSAVLVDDLTTDPRWSSLHAVAAREGLASVLTVAAPLPASSRTLVLSWYAREPHAFGSADCSRVALLAAAHTSLALDRALREDHLRAAMVSRQQIGQAVGLLAARRSVGLADAFALLRTESQRSNVRLAELARRIVEEQG